MCNLITGEDVRLGLKLALSNLIDEKENLNKLNLFPVADKDTGTNLVHSVRHTVENLPQKTAVSDVFSDVSNLLLKYAYGSSGTILNMFFEGFAEAASDFKKLAGDNLAKAYAFGIRCATESVDAPENGTILSVGYQSALAGLSVSEITTNPGIVWERITQEAHVALRLTPLHNPKLKGTGVIDSGAYGFCLILDGFLKSFSPSATIPPYPRLVFPQAGHAANNKSSCEALPSERPSELLYKYCTEFVATINHIDIVDDIKTSISSLGNCFLCVINKDLIKVHIHTNEPEKVFELGEQIGQLCSRKVDDMESVPVMWCDTAATP